MADTLTSALATNLSWILTEGGPLSTVQDSAQLNFESATADGVGAGQADVLWHDRRTLAAGAHDDLDLAGGLTRSLFGGSVTIAFAKAKAIVVKSLATASGDVLRVGPGAASNSFTAPFGGVAGALVEVGPGSLLVLCELLDGWTVTPGTADILRITNTSGTNSVDYDIALLGTSS